METADNPDVNIKPPPLNSDQLNYLIWRYLQEKGYGDSAVKLQRDWNINPEELPFAKHIKGQALIKLVQYGLRYHYTNIQIDETGRSAKPLQPAMLFFGPESLEAPKVLHDNLVIRPSSSGRQSSPDDASVNGLRKHPRELDPETLAQPAPKRPRKSLNANNILQPSTTNTGNVENGDSMEIDTIENHDLPHSTPVRPPGKSARPTDAETADDANGGVNGRNGSQGMDVQTSAFPGVGSRIGGFEPQPQEQPVEPIPPPPTLTNGISVAIQSEDQTNIADLSPHTTILSTPQGQGLDVTTTLWRANDSSTVTGYGPEFCGIWNASTPRSPATGPRAYHGIFDKRDNLYVSAVAWDHSGNYLAIATYTNAETRGHLSVYEGAELALVETLPASQKMITRLHWANSQTLIGLAPCDDPTPQADKTTAIVLWDIQASNMGLEAIKHASVPQLIHDLDSSIPPRNDFSTAQITGYMCLAGEDVVYEYHVAGASFSDYRKWTEQDVWIFGRCSNVSRFVVAASNDSVWIPEANIVLRDRHSGVIVDLRIRPKPLSEANYENRFFVEDFATASDDNTIRVWRFDAQKQTADMMFKVRSPSMALSYSVDGQYFAGANVDKLQVWRADRQSPAVASWDASGSSWRGASVVEDERTTNGDVSMNGDFSIGRGDHSLSWDSASRKIAFGLGEQIALIEFQPS